MPRSSSLGDPTIPVSQLMKPYPAYTTVSLYRNNVGTTRYNGLELSVRQRMARGLLYSVAYTRSKLVDDASSVFDASILTGPIANYPVADSFNRSLERDYSTGDMPHVFASSIVWDLPIGAGRQRQAQGVLGAIVNDWTVTSMVTLQSGMPIAVTQTTNFNAFAGFGVQRPNQVGDPTKPADQRTASSVVQHGRVRDRAESSRSGRRRAIPYADPRIAMSIWRSSGACRCMRVPRSRSGRRSSICSTR